jgi:hypothetical protein
VHHKQDRQSEVFGKTAQKLHDSPRAAR